jgi:hypothetical protein
MDTEDKQSWCSYGEDVEKSFAGIRLPSLGLGGFVNPQKAKDKYTHDLFVQFPCDLKTVRTPFFKAKEMFGIDPQYAVTFNEKDGTRYSELYPNIIVIFDISWDDCGKVINGVQYNVKPMHLTVSGFLKDIKRAIVASGLAKVDYARRVNDTQGNAKRSWVFDARHLQKIS